MDDSEEERPVSLFFGSSDTGMFSLLRGDSIRVNRFPGATAKGLGQGNAKSKAIEHTILHKYCRSPIHALVWMFGTVDVKFSYYFKACTEQQSEGEIDPEAAMMSCAVKYFNFVRSMHAATNAMTVVIGCEPNGAPPDRVYEQLLRYGIVLDSPQNRQKVNDAVKVCRPETLRRTFNATLEQLCQVSGFHYIDIDNDILHENALLLPADRSVVGHPGDVRASELGGQSFKIHTQTAKARISDRRDPGSGEYASRIHRRKAEQTRKEETENGTWRDRRLILVYLITGRLHSPMLYFTLLDAELDDWIDPILPRMYTLSETKDFVFTDEFTDANEEFCETLLMPSWTPVMTSNGLCLLGPKSHLA